ncbi:MAG TPA: YccF domain-containing protein [Acidimicrobiia bacterium]|nr:YccF domain-containing protein [Acidimicrobiia bacterium]
MLTIAGNILWLILCGIWMAILYFIGGLLGLILIITIPLGIQSFKLGNYVLWPFGRTVVTEPGASVVWSVIGNVIWVIVAGWWLALFHVALAVIFFITIIGIPFGIANLKLARLALLPFGAIVVTEVPPDAQTIVVVPQLGATAAPQSASPAASSPQMGGTEPPEITGRSSAP